MNNWYNFFSSLSGVNVVMFVYSRLEKRELLPWKLRMQCYISNLLMSVMLIIMLIIMIIIIIIIIIMIKNQF